MDQHRFWRSVLKQLCKSLAIGVDRAADEEAADSLSAVPRAESGLESKKGEVQ